ncbi:MAG: RluA family pseudouridine synthase [Cyclobacteriaceae bacterium]|nr:RluA family pseudouridine synthase [Cyclobacteriaceae bacterium]MCH8515955.1 RluA family pseudouridine synthase [Cyclobacteriaceae bacterium]
MENHSHTEGEFEHYRFVADKKQEMVRIDKFLMDRLPNTSRTRIQQTIKEGQIRVNDEEVKTNYKIRPSDVVTVVMSEPPRDTEVYPEDIPLDIIYEDDALLVVNKPAGMVVHPGHENWTGTLVNALTHHFQNLPTMPDNEGRPGLVHRIDKDTSGLLVVAKTEIAMTHLAKQFFDHSIERTYRALVWGEPNPAEGTIDVNLGRSFKDRRLTDVFPDGDFGKRAVTHYQTEESIRYVSLISCKLETGRTHQIRAHMKSIGHPIFADEMYGGMQIRKGTLFSKYKSFVQNTFKVMPRQALHAFSLGFIHPVSGDKLYFEQPLPEEFELVLQRWRDYVNHH